MKLFVCFASTGEYSDRMEQVIKAVKTEEAAKMYVSESVKLESELVVQSGEKSVYHMKYADRERLFVEGWNPHAPTLAEPDYTGWNFYYEETELED